MNKILGVGNASIDYLAVVEKFPVPNEKSSAKFFDIQGGGTCANTMVTLSRLGVDCSIITKIGNDLFGDQILKSLKDENINTDYISRTGETSSFSFVLVHKNTRTVIDKGGPSYNSPLKINTRCLSNIDLIYLDGRYHKSALELAKIAKEKKIKIVVDAERTDLHVEKLFKYADMVITSDNFHRNYFKNKNYYANLKKIQNYGPKIAIVTLGENGSIGLDKKESLKIPAYRTKVVDTTGAGDAYLGGFLYGYINSWTFEKSLRFASKIAAINCRSLGARKGLPNKKQLKIF